MHCDSRQATSTCVYTDDETCSLHVPDQACQGNDRLDWAYLLEGQDQGQPGLST